MNALRKNKTAEIFHSYVKDIPRSGTEKELYDLFGISAEKLMLKVAKILKRK